MLGVVVNLLVTVMLPVGALSFGMVWWALDRGHVEGNRGSRALNREIKALAKARKRNRKGGDDAGSGGPGTDPMHRKWLKFGGGFYGMVALYTYLRIEWRDLSDFVAGLGGLAELLERFNVGMLVNLLLEAMFNFVVAVAWPVQWLVARPPAHALLWVVAAYAGYWLGMQLAQRVVAGAWRPDARPGNPGGGA